MADLLDLARALSTPVKLAWVLWLFWGAAALLWHRRRRTAAAPAAAAAAEVLEPLEAELVDLHGPADDVWRTWDAAGDVITVEATATEVIDANRPPEAPPEPSHAPAGPPWSSSWAWPPTPAQAAPAPAAGALALLPVSSGLCAERGTAPAGTAAQAAWDVHDAGFEIPESACTDAAASIGRRRAGAGGRRTRKRMDARIL